MMKDNEVYMHNEPSCPLRFPPLFSSHLVLILEQVGSAAKIRLPGYMYENLQTNKKSPSESWRHDNGPPNGLTVLIYEKEKKK